MAVINHLKSVRDNYHLNKQDIAFATGSSRESISRYERSENVPSLEMALRLAYYYHLSVEELFQLDKDSKRCVKISG